MHPKYAPVLFGFLLSGFMSLIVSGVATLRVVGFIEDFFAIWGSSWLSSWVIAFPVVLVVAPMVRRIIAKLVKQPGPTAQPE